MKGTVTRILLAGGLVGSLSAVGFAQTAPPQAVPQQGPEATREGRAEGMGRRMGRRFDRRALLHGLRALNLSDAQREQMRAIAQRFRAANKEEHAELRQLMQLRRQGGELSVEQEARAQELIKGLRESRESLRQEMLGVLTPEQRTQLEQWRKERRERREQLRQLRRLMRGEMM